MRNSEWSDRGLEVGIRDRGQGSGVKGSKGQG